MKFYGLNWLQKMSGVILSKWVMYGPNTAQYTNKLLLDSW